MNDLDRNYIQRLENQILALSQQLILTNQTLIEVLLYIEGYTVPMTKRDIIESRIKALQTITPRRVQ